MNVKKSILLTFLLFSFTQNFGAEAQNAELFKIFNQTNNTFDIFFFINEERITADTIEAHEDKEYPVPLGNDRTLELVNNRDGYYILIDLEHHIEGFFVVRPEN